MLGVISALAGIAILSFVPRAQMQSKLNLEQPNAVAADGDLDSTFGNGGTVISTFSNPSNQIFGVAIQSDGKVIAAGAAASNFALTRYNVDGSLDGSFGTGGKVSTDFFGDDEEINAIALQSDGRIVVAGYAFAPTFHTLIALARYNTNGSLDTSFGSGGKQTLGPSGQAGQDGALAVAIQADGKIVVTAQNAANAWLLARFNVNGSLDDGTANDSTPGDSFGSSGLVTTAFPGSTSFQTANSLAIQSNGKIVAAGYGGVPSGLHSAFLLARYNIDGSLDTSFGTGGTVLTNFSIGNSGLNGVCLQSDGKIVAAGTNGGGANVILARYDTNGALDPSFGTGGQVTSNSSIGAATIGAVALQSNGRIVLAGGVRVHTSSVNDFALFRYNADGSTDATFGTGGVVTTQLRDVNSFNAVAIQTDGKIVGGGYTSVSGDFLQPDFALARYLNSGGSPTPSPSPSPSPSPTPAPTLSFSQAAYGTSEDTGSVTLTVNRSGDLSGAVTVDYATTDGTALQKTDYTIASGTLTFAAGVTSKTLTVLINKDSYSENTETFNVTLSNSTAGASLGAISVATVNIADGSPPASGNTIDDNSMFVQQHYYDFLARVPDQGGLNYWIAQLTQCGADATCLRNQRIAVSDAFFFEQEYQKTGAYVYRIYRVAFGNNQPVPNTDTTDPERLKLPGYSVFAPDRARVIGSATLTQGQLDFANGFVQRPAFLAKYPAGLDGPLFVDAILATVKNDLGVDLTAQRAAFITVFNSGGRGAVVYRLADDNAQTNPIDNHLLIDAEYNRAFVATQYFGYFRRDSDMAGFSFWLGQANSAPLRDVAKQHALVCSFITSQEYQHRFGALATHSNADCQQ